MDKLNAVEKVLWMLLCFCISVFVLSKLGEAVGFVIVLLQSFIP